MLLLGNDIVDLNEAGVRGKWQHARFVDRVFTATEQTFIQKSSDRDNALWALWAAKESAYKLISKIGAPPVFSHKKFAAALENILPLQQEAVALSLTVEFEKHRAGIEVAIRPDHILAQGQFATRSSDTPYSVISGTGRIAFAEKAGWPNRQFLEENFSAAERESIHHAAAARVRFLCKQAIAERIGVDLACLEIIRPVRGAKPQPPYLLLENNRCDIDISLSHHGQWVAWCASVT